MAEIGFSGKLPKGSANGLGPIVHALTTRPDDCHVVLLIVDTMKITTNTDSGEVVPTIRIRRAEVILPQDRDIAEQLLTRSMEKRTGRTTLPFELHDELRNAFGHHGGEHD